MKPTTIYDPVRIEFLDGALVRVLEPIPWRGPHPETVPSGFISDGGSKPAWTWPILGHPLSRRVLICYLLHDLDLERGVAWGKAADRLDARLRAVGCPTVRRWAIVGGVRAYGWRR